MRLLYRLFIIPILLCTIELNASPQIPDYIIFKGDTIITYNLLLEQYFRLQGKEDKGMLFGLSFVRDSPQAWPWVKRTMRFNFEGGQGEGRLRG